MFKGSFIVSDASVYDIEPKDVYCPLSTNDLVVIVKKLLRLKRNITMRAGGTSLGGQAIGFDVVIDISSNLCNILSINEELSEAVVEPGVILDDLNYSLSSTGLHFAPDNSTSNRAMIGGMIGNNSCGSYSVLYGTTREHVKSVDVILSDGSEVVFSELTDFELEQKLKQKDFEGKIYRGVIDILNSKGTDILESYPDSTLVRRNTGYALDVLYSKYQPFNKTGLPFNLTPLICGSEGTLAIIKKATLNLEKTPKKRGVLCPHYNSILDALSVVKDILLFKPAAIEVIDKATLDCTKNNLLQSKNRFWIEADPQAVLVIEVFAENDLQLNNKLKKLQDWLLLNSAYASPIIDPPNISRVWAVRKAGLGLLMGKKGKKKAVAVIEDAAVPVAVLADYFIDVQKLMDQLSVSCVYYGHASVGLIHIRPELDLSVENDKKLFKEIAFQHALIIKKYKGAISGEHGDGRIRAPYIKLQLGESIYDCLVSLKELFDPEYLLNPGVIIGNEDITNNLRASNKQLQSIKTGYSWDAEISLLDAVEKCNGAGVCRKSSGKGVMCPSYQATREENNSTRGRSNLLRHALTDIDIQKSLNADNLKKALRLCLACKACKTECPASVDMARLKSEVLFQTQRTLSLSRLFNKFYGSILRISQVSPLLFNYAQNLGFIKSLINVDSRRSLPTLVAKHHDLKTWWKGYNGVNDCVNKGDRTVLVLCDLFSQYLDPNVGKSVIKSLVAIGLNVIPIFFNHSPRSLLSQGLVDEAKVELRRVIKEIRNVKQFNYIVGIEPAELLVWRDEIKSLLLETEILQEHFYLFEELILELDKIGGLISFKPLNKKLHVHVHCHQKSLVGFEHAISAFDLIPDLDVSYLNVGCCGMAGDFGYKEFDLSKKIAEQQLLPQINQIKSDDLIVATGLSCRHQIVDLSARQSLHPAQIFLRVL